MNKRNQNKEELVREFGTELSKGVLSFLSRWRRFYSWMVLISYCGLLGESVFGIWSDNKRKVNEQTTLKKELSKKIGKIDTDRGEVNKGIKLPLNSRLIRDDYQNVNRYWPYMELGSMKNFNQESGFSMSYDFFLPLFQDIGQLFFADIRVMDRSGKSAEGNFHLGYRQIYAENRLWGIYGAYDLRRSNHHKFYHQMTLGFEHWGGKLFLGGNIYLPFGKTKKELGIIKGSEGNDAVSYYDKALFGIDGELGYALNEKFRGYIGGYCFGRKREICGPKGRISYEYRTEGKKPLGILTGVALELGWQYDRVRGLNGYLGLKFKLGLGSNSRVNPGGFEGHIVELVKRDPDIVVLGGYSGVIVDEKKQSSKPKYSYNYADDNGNGGNRGDKPDGEETDDDYYARVFHEDDEGTLLELLGLNKNATDSEVSARYKQLAMKYHPDKGGRHIDFININAIVDRLRVLRRGRAKSTKPKDEGYEEKTDISRKEDRSLVSFSSTINLIQGFFLEADHFLNGLVNLVAPPGVKAQDVEIGMDLEEQMFPVFREQINRWKNLGSVKERWKLIEEMVDYWGVVLFHPEQGRFIRDKFLSELRLTRNKKFILLAEVFEEIVKDADLTKPWSIKFKDWLVRLAKKVDAKKGLIKFDQGQLNLEFGEQFWSNPSELENFTAMNDVGSQILFMISFDDFRSLDTFRNLISYLSADRSTHLELLSKSLERALVKEIYQEYPLNQLEKQNFETLFSNRILDNYQTYYRELIHSYLELLGNKCSLRNSYIEHLEEMWIKLVMPGGLNWPMDKMFIQLVQNTQGGKCNQNFQSYLRLLNTLAVNDINPELANHRGDKVSDLVFNITSNLNHNGNYDQLIRELGNLVRDNKSKGTKEVKELLDELRNLNQGNEVILKLLDENYFIKYWEKIKELLNGNVLLERKQLKKWEKGDFYRWRSQLKQVNDENIGEILAVLCQAAYNTVLKKNYPRAIQIFSILTLYKFSEGGIIQINTGEGKSLVNALFASISVLKGYKVDVVTSSIDLAIRDVEAYRDFYQLLGISVDHNGVDHNGDTDTEKQCYGKNIVYGTASNYIGDLLAGIRGPRDFEVLISDEADSLVIDEIGYRVQLAHTDSSGFELLNPLMSYIYGTGVLLGGQLQQQNDGCYFRSRIGMTKRKEEEGWEFDPFEEVNEEDKSWWVADDCQEFMREDLYNYTYKNLFSFEDVRENRTYVVPRHLEDYAINQLPKWIDSFFSCFNHQLNKTYIITQKEGEVENLVPVDPSTGVINPRLRWGNGLHQLLEHKHQLMVETEKASHTFMSYYNYFNKYRGRIYGMTGTLGNDLEKKFLKENYGVELGIIPSFIFKDLHELKNIFTYNRYSWEEEVLNSIYWHIYISKRSGLIVVADIAELEKVREMVSKEFGSNLKLISYGTGAPKESKNLEREFGAREVIIATNLGGRGIDIKNNQEVLSNGGLHVIITNYPDNARVEDQVRGRAARKGEPGSSQLIINLDNYDEECQNLAEDDILPYLEKKRGIEEQHKLEYGQQFLLPYLKLFDEFFSAVVKLTEEIDSPTEYQLLLGKPKSNDELINSSSLYVYEEKNYIRLKVVNIAGARDIDITEDIRAIDKIAENHLRIVLSSQNGDKILSNQLREIIHFIAIAKGYSKKDSLYKLVNHRSDLKNRYQQWLSMRKKYNNNEYEIKQIMEDWGLWLNSYPTKPLSKMEKKDEEEIRNDFEKFKKSIMERMDKKGRENLINNPTYYVLKAWQYFQIHKHQAGDRKKAYPISDPLAEAVHFLEEAIKLDDIYSWPAHNAVGYIRLIKDGEHIWKVNQVNEANKVKQRFIEDTQRAIAKLEYSIEVIDGQLFYLHLVEAGVINYQSKFYLNLLGNREFLRIIKETLEKNLEIARQSHVNQMIRPKPIDISELIKKVNVVQITQNASMNSNGTNSTKANDEADLIHHLYDVNGGLKYPGKEQMLEQLRSAGVRLYEIETYELKKKHSWFGNIISAVTGVIQIVAGIALIGTGLGGVFFGTLSTALIFQGIGDLINAGRSFIDNDPIDFRSYLNAKGLSLGVSVFVGGLLWGLNVVGVHWIGNMVQNILPNGEILGRLAGMGAFQIIVQIFGGLIYDVSRREIDAEEIRREVKKEMEKLLADPKYRIILDKIFAIDNLKNNQNLRNLLDEHIEKIVAEYSKRFQDDKTKFARESLNELIGALAGRNIGSIVRAATEVTFGSIKNKEAVSKIMSEIKKNLEESNKKLESILGLIEIELIKSYGNSQGTRLAQKLNSYLSSSNGQPVATTCNDLREIKEDQELLRYGSGLGDICEKVTKNFEADYSSDYREMLSQWEEKISQMIIEVQKNELVTPLSNLLRETAANFVLEGTKKMIRKIKERENKKVTVKDSKSKYQVLNNEGQPLANKQQYKREPIVPQSLEGEITYKIRKGDTLSQIAYDQGVNYKELLTVNPQIKNPDRIHPGQSITIPPRARNNSPHNTFYKHKPIPNNPSSFNDPYNFNQAFPEIVLSSMALECSNGQCIFKTEPDSFSWSIPTLDSQFNFLFETQIETQRFNFNQNSDQIGVLAQYHFCKINGCDADTARKYLGLAIRLAAEASSAAYHDEIIKYKRKAETLAKTYKNAIDESLFYKLLKAEGYAFLEDSSNQNGFYGVALKKASTNEIIVSFRGTQITDLQDLYADFQLVAGSIPKQYNSALRFTESIIQKYPEGKITLVGHSLGGALAQITAAELNLMAIVVESPGVKEQILNLMKEKYGWWRHYKFEVNERAKNIIIVNSMPNAVNSLGEHINKPIVIQYNSYPSMLLVIPTDGEHVAN